jgi:hypothetical protein
MGDSSYHLHLYSSAQAEEQASFCSSQRAELSVLRYQAGAEVEVVLLDLNLDLPLSRNSV